MEGLREGLRLVHALGGIQDSGEVDVRVESIRKYNRSRAVPYHLRSPDRIAGFFDGLELVDPGVVPRNHWRPDNDEPPAPSGGVGAVGRKP